MGIVYLTWTVVDKPNSSNWYGFRNFFDTYVKTEQYNCSKKKRRNALCEDASIGDIIQVKGSSDK